LSVCDSEFVGIFFTDGQRPSAYLLSVIPNSIAKSVGKKKTIADGFTDRNCAPKKIFLLEIYQRIYSIGDSGISSKYFSAPG
jgi:hypothetical protein